MASLATGPLATTQGRSVVDAVAAHVDVVTAWSLPDTEARYSSADPEAGLAQVKAERPCFHALSDIEPQPNQPSLLDDAVRLRQQA
jgi:hypothetical protein